MPTMGTPRVSPDLLALGLILVVALGVPHTAASEGLNATRRLLKGRGNQGSSKGSGFWSVKGTNYVDSNGQTVSTEQYSTVKYSAVQYITACFSTSQHSTCGLQLAWRRPAPTRGCDRGHAQAFSRTPPGWNPAGTPVTLVYQPHTCHH